MKKNLTLYMVALTLLSALAVPVQMAAQDEAKQNHLHQPHHYQVVDLGNTFVGPQSYFALFVGRARTEAL